MKIRIFSNLQIAILLFLVGIGLARASYRSLWHIDSFSLKSEAGQTCIKLSTPIQVEPVVEIDRKDSLIRIDFVGLEFDKTLANHAFNDDLVRLGYLFNHRGSSKAAGLRIYPRRGGLKSIKKTSTGFEIWLAEDTNLASNVVHSSESLLDPRQEKFQPVILHLNNAPAVPVIQKLAEKADISLRFSGQIPESLSTDLEAANPEQALRMIAEDMGCQLHQENNLWLMSGAS
jgi:hypothetical protein